MTSRSATPSDPTGTWTIYYVPAQNDGTEGTPNHGCTLDGSAPGPCFQDYPHIGGDNNGVYISTNEYDLFGPSYSAAQIFAFSKTQLAAHPAAINVTLVEDIMVDGSPGFTVWPAISTGRRVCSEGNGTEYLLSTIAGDGLETGNPTGTASRLGLWAFTNTASLDTATPSLGITSRLIEQPDVRVPAEVRSEARRHPARRVHQRHHHPDAVRPGMLAVLLLSRGRAGPRRGGVDTRLARSRMQQTWYGQRHAVGGDRHGGQSRRRAQGRDRLVRA